MLPLGALPCGRHVLVIDGDPRKGRLHEIFQVSNAWGLSDLPGGEEAASNPREDVFRGSRFLQPIYYSPLASTDRGSQHADLSFPLSR